MSRVLVAGGSGMIGSIAASHLAERGDQVTVLARHAATDDDPPAIAGLPRLVGDYSQLDVPERELARFDAVVFAAGQDIRHVAEDAEDPAFWDRMQRIGVPAFAALARSAGVARFVQIGSYYHHLMPALANTLPYVAARQAADERTRALSADGFSAITLNPPSIVGTTPGRGVRRFARMLSWLRGETPEPVVVPPGGTNYMSARSLAEAIAGALDVGEPGRAYLVGDANLTFREFFQLLADAGGSEVRVEERDEPSPWQPDRFIVQGRGAVISYEPEPADVARLGYQRRDVPRAVDEIVSLVDATPHGADRKQKS